MTDPYDARYPGLATEDPEVAKLARWLIGNRPDGERRGDETPVDTAIRALGELKKLDTWVTANLPGRDPDGSTVDTAIRVLSVVKVAVPTIASVITDMISSVMPVLRDAGLLRRDGD